MASAVPLRISGKEIVVYQSRVQPLMRDIPSAAHLILGYVLSHELAHMMQGINRHSDSGIMKARWSRADLEHMLAGGMGFDEPDVILIRDGLEVRIAAR